MDINLQILMETKGLKGKWFQVYTSTAMDHDNDQLLGALLVLSQIDFPTTGYRCFNRIMRHVEAKVCICVVIEVVMWNLLKFLLYLVGSDGALICSPSESAFTNSNYLMAGCRFSSFSEDRSHVGVVWFLAFVALRVSTNLPSKLILGASWPSEGPKSRKLYPDYSKGCHHKAVPHHVTEAPF